MIRNKNKNRPACMSDLKDYFRKIDLFEGLTEIEKDEARTNLGIVNYVGEDGQLAPLEITHEALWLMVVEKKIVVGARYIITDFQTIYPSQVLSSNGIKVTWGLDINPSPIMPLLVVGLTSSSLDTNATVIGKKWEVKYDITKTRLPDGKYTKGRIVWMKDTNSNSAYYDFKNVKFRRTDFKNSSITGVTSLDMYTFSTVANGEAVDISDTESVEYNELKQNSWNNVFIGKTKNNIFEAELNNNTFFGGCCNSHLMWNTEGNTFKEAVAHTTGSISNYISTGKTNSAFSTQITKNIHVVNNNTILTFLDDITYSQQIVILK